MNSALKNHGVLDFDTLRARLKLRSITSEKKLREKHPLAHKFFQNSGLKPGQIRQHAARILASGALAGTLLLSAPPIPIIGTANQTPNAPRAVSPELNFAIAQISLANSLKAILPPVGEWALTSDQEKKISKTIHDALGINASAELDGNRLPNSYGRMGAEQHLPRYPGDSVDQHERLQEKGITPGLGGWGYFTYSKDQMTPELYDDEKWYVAVQTLYIPDWNTRTKYYVDWFKYRKVVVVNPANGKTVVADVADAGPANWTGKHFGGSPEVMEYLGINFGMQNSPVVLYFLDDSNKDIPLGPLEYNIETNKKLTERQA